MISLFQHLFHLFTIFRFNLCYQLRLLKTRLFCILFYQVLSNLEVNNHFIAQHLPSVDRFVPVGFASVGANLMANFKPPRTNALSYRKYSHSHINSAHAHYSSSMGRTNKLLSINYARLDTVLFMFEE